MTPERRHEIRRALERVATETPLVAPSGELMVDPYGMPLAVRVVLTLQALDALQRLFPESE